MEALPRLLYAVLTDTPRSAKEWKSTPPWLWSEHRAKVIRVFLNKEDALIFSGQEKVRRDESNGDIVWVEQWKLTWWFNTEELEDESHTGRGEFLLHHLTYSLHTSRVM